MADKKRSEMTTAELTADIQAGYDKEVAANKNEGNFPKGVSDGQKQASYGIYTDAKSTLGKDNHFYGHMNVKNPLPGGMVCNKIIGASGL